MLHKLITGTFQGDPDAEPKANLTGEILGAAAFGLATWLPHPKAFVFLGETASNGKSTIASLLACLLPAGSVSSIPPSAFGDERRIINLAGKAANVADELSAAAISGETFKAAVTGDPIEGRDLYRSAVTFVPKALHCFTTNTLPRFNGGIDRGLQRRLVVLRFNRQIPENEIIADISQRIRRDEMELLLGFAVGGAQRLIRNQSYTIPASSKEALHGWLMLDPMHEWFDARIVQTESEPYDGWPSTRKLFTDFKAWALEQGHQERFLPPVNTFSQRLKSFPNVQIKRLSRGSVAAGIKLSDKVGW
jgi:phage/plasmid-associated DNA primase